MTTLAEIWLQKISIAAGILLFALGAVYCSRISFFSNVLGYGNVFTSFPLFEQHFWQFCISFAAIIFLSRGHLWSFGINSKNLNRSMVYLFVLYFAAMVFNLLLTACGIRIPEMPADRWSICTAAGQMVIFWMSSPIANSILFFGLVQTALLKYVDSSFKILTIPVSVYLSAAVYSFMLPMTQTVTPFMSTYGVTFIVGLYSGIVYWKTGSLITPMLGQAFWFGFPVFLKILPLF